MFDIKSDFDQIWQDLGVRLRVERNHHHGAALGAGFVPFNLLTN